MSFTKGMLEDHEKIEAFTSVLKRLLDEGEIEHPTSKGIAKKIIDVGKIDELSPSQLNVLNNYIKPLIEKHCENEGCGKKLDIRELDEAYNNQHEFGKLFCINCLSIEIRLKIIASKKE
jgi:hypothetical protein